MPEIMLVWPAFAFTQESEWGRVFLAFLQSAYDRSGSMNTLVHYRQILRDFFSDPTKQPDAYSRDDVERFIHSPSRGRGREGLAVKPGTQNHRLSALTSFYAYAAGYTIADAQNVIRPVLRVPPPTIGIRQIKRARAYHTLTVSEVEAFFSCIPKDSERGLKYRALFMTFLYTARRRSEILALRYADIERVTIIENGKSREAFQYVFYGKGRKRIRDQAELPGPAIVAIFAYLEQSGRLKDIQPDHAIFTADTNHIGRGGYDPKRPLSPQAILDASKKYARLAGIDEKKMNIHAWRHVSARTRYEQGEDIRSIQQLLRHSSLATTDIYLRELAPLADEGAKLLEKRFHL